MQTYLRKQARRRVLSLQRAGRIIRQGNQNPEVHIYRYVTEATFDAYSWQTVETKQRFISQIMTSKSPVRSCEDVDETALSYAEVKALCAGDPRIKEKMDLDVDVAKLKMLKADHQSKQHWFEDNVHIRYPVKIETLTADIAKLENDSKTVESHPHPEDGFAGMEVDGVLHTDKDAAGTALLEAFKNIQDTASLPIGSYRGFQMAISLEFFGNKHYLTLKGEKLHQVELGKDVRGNLIRIDNVLNNIPARIQAAQDEIQAVREQIEKEKIEMVKPFPQEEELQQKNARLVELNSELDMEKDMQEEQETEAPVKAEPKEKPSILARLRSQPPQAPANNNPTRNLHKQEVL